MNLFPFGNTYLGLIIERLQRIVATQEAKIRAAAALLTEQVRNDRLIHVYGVGGHSFVGSEEFFYRAGGLANISPMFELSLGLCAGGQKSTMLERVPGIGDKIVRAHRLGEGDVLIITSVYGMNAATIDAALEAKKRGVKIIAISSIEFARSTPKGFQARHPSDQDLCEIADITIDNHVPPGEVLVDLPDYPQRIGGSCNVLACFCINWLVMETIQHCLQAGLEPPVWRSANVPGGDEFNAALLDKYTPRVKAL
jgi:uncharacterized phosphosugar-binding protein